MLGSAVPAFVGIILLVLVAVLAAVVDRRSAEGRWFALLNLFLAATASFGAANALAPEHEAGRALVYGRLANLTTTLAFTCFYFQLAAMARQVDHPHAKRLRRLIAPVAVLNLAIGLFASYSPLFVSGVVWSDGVGFRPVFGPALAVVLSLVSLIGLWAIALLVTILRHGPARRRREVAWMSVGVLVFDFFGLVLLATLLPRLGIVQGPAWAPTSLAVGSVIMLCAMVLVRQHELESLESSRSALRRPRGSGGAKSPGTRSCTTCGAMLHGAAETAFCPLDGGAIVEHVDPWPGRTIDGRYQIESLIGAGGMGRVYRALHLKLGEKVAIKLLNGDLAADGRTSQRFAREARSTLRIRSPHVVRVHDLGELPPGLPFLIMELISGLSLAQLLAGGLRLSRPSVALLGAQLARGLADAHAEGVIHRDLKPDNVLVAREAERHVAKIVDFGLAKICGEELGSGELTTIGRVFGTPAYISPEQAAGRGAEPASDLYALGVVLYRARSGRAPFTGSALELLSSHLHKEPPPLGEDPLDRLIMSLLAKSPAARPTAATVIETLTALAGAQALLALDSVTEERQNVSDPTLPVSAISTRRQAS
jgi:hypothetical protein